MAVSNKLSDKFLKSIYGKPYSGKTVISDGEGLSIRVSKNGVIGWLYRYRLGGRESNPISLGLGSYPDTSLKQARAKREQCRNWLDNGKDPKFEYQQLGKQRLEAVTVKQALEYWLVEYAEEGRANSDKHKRQFERHIYPYIGHLPLDKTETRHWVECFDRIRNGVPTTKQKAAPVAAGYILQNAKQALRFCRVRHFATSRVLDDLMVTDVGKKQQKKDRFLSDSELVDVWNMVQSENHQPYYRNLIRMLVVFGARSQELRLSRWNEWDFLEGIWIVPKEHSKTSDKIVRPIPESMVSWLLELKGSSGSDDYVLGELKRPEAVSQKGRMLWKSLDHSEAWTLHDLRRTFATRLNDLGIAPHVVEQLLGHSLGGVMAIYNRSQYLTEKRQALDIWLERLKLLSNPESNIVVLNRAQV